MGECEICCGQDHSSYEDFGDNIESETGYGGEY